MALGEVEVEDRSFLQHAQYTQYPTLLRVLPWLLTVLSANALHYSSLLQTRSQAKRAARAADSPPPLSFSLMNSPPMRAVRYKIKLLRYCATLIFLLLFWGSIPELFLSFKGTSVEAFVVGLLAGFITIFLNENRALNMRTPWKPSLDFHSAIYGCMWDMLRLAGDSLLVPFEEELFYHSWLYRYLCFMMSNSGHYHHSFAEVPFTEWNWGAWIICNAVLALYNGQEWRSFGISGLLCNWVIARRGQVMDGVVAHAIRNLTVSVCVLAAGQRQYW